MWQDTAIDQPANGQDCWCRRWWYAAPFLATWDSSTKTFTAVWGGVIPWYEVSRWKAA